MRPKIPLLVYCQDPVKGSVISYSISVNAHFRVTLSSSLLDCFQAIEAGGLRGVVIVAPADGANNVAASAFRCGVPVVYHVYAQNSELFEQIKIAVALKRGPKAVVRQVTKEVA